MKPCSSRLGSNYNAVKVTEQHRLSCVFFYSVTLLLIHQDSPPLESARDICFFCDFPGQFRKSLVLLRLLLWGNCNYPETMMLERLPVPAESSLPAISTKVPNQMKPFERLLQVQVFQSSFIQATLAMAPDILEQRQVIFIMPYLNS